MTTHAIDQGTICGAVELANRAPSVHNTQPWRWLLGDRTLHLYADLQRWLPATDSDGRDLVISCGAALHHARVALAAAGIPTRVHRLPNPDEADHLAAIELGRGSAAEADLALASAIPARRTDRRPFGTWPVPLDFVIELATRAANEGVVLRAVDASQRSRLISAIRDAETLQAELPGYPTELALWSGRHANVDGIPAANLPRGPVDPSQAARRFTEGEIEPLGHAVDGARLLVLGTTSDDNLSHLRAGEALSAVLLHATELGLATCPLSQPLEIAATRRTVRDQILHGTLSPQMLIRVGWAPTGPPLRATPRRPVGDTIGPLDG
jgi:nitroreductase